MGCSVHQEKISDYIDDLLLEVERRPLEEHLSACSKCHEVYEDLVLICQASRTLPEYEPSEGVWERILAEVTASGTSGPTSVSSRWATWWLPSKIMTSPLRFWKPALVAALLIVGISALMVYRQDSLSQPDSSISDRLNWTDGRVQVDVHPTNNLIVHKPMIEVEIVHQRIEELQRHIQVLQPRWSPGVRAFYQRNLRLIDDCLSRCQDEGTIPSQDQAMREVYQAALRAKLELLKQFSSM